MQKPGLALIALLVVLAVPVLATAAELYTPLISIETGERIECTGLNVSSKAALLVIAELIPCCSAVTLISFDGHLGPGEAFAIGRAGPDSLYCKFTVDGPKSAILGGASISPGGRFIPAQ